LQSGDDRTNRPQSPRMARLLDIRKNEKKKVDAGGLEEPLKAPVRESHVFDGKNVRNQ